MHTKKRKHTGRRITIALILVLALLAALVWGFYQSKLNLLIFDDGVQEIDTQTKLPLDDLELPDMGDAYDRESKLPTGDAVTDKDVVNILLLGTDDRSTKYSENARADAIMLLSLNLRTHKIKLVSIERGIGVPIPGRNDDWLTHTFRYGGAALTMQTVQDCFKVDVSRYIRVNFHAFREGIDAIGGVDITLTQAEADYLNHRRTQEGYDLQPVTAGLNHLDGNTALEYARARKLDSDWKRIERQRNVIQAALNQVASADLLTLNKLLDTILPTIRTNLTKNEITQLLLEIPGFLAEGLQIEQMTIPTEDTCWNSVGVDGRKLIAVDFEANAKILQDFFYEGELND